MRLVESYSDQLATISIFEVAPYYLVTFSYTHLMEIKGNVCLGIEQAVDLYNQCVEMVKERQLMVQEEEMKVLGLTLGAIIYTLIFWPNPERVSIWDFSGGVFTGAFSYYLSTKM